MAPRPTHILHLYRIGVPFFANRGIALKSSMEFRNVQKKLLVCFTRQRDEGRSGR
jgi:hypothetical protein